MADLQPTNNPNATNALARLETEPFFTEWQSAWAEITKRYPRMTRGWLIVSLLVFNFGGQSVLGLLSYLYGWLPWWAFALTLLLTLVITQMFVIRFAGLAHAREKEELQAALSSHKLKFKIDEVSSRVYIQVPSQDTVMITAKIKLRFENEDIHDWTMKTLTMTLHNLEAPNQEILTFVVNDEYLHCSNQQQIPREQFEGMLVQAGRVTPWCLYWVYLVTAPDSGIKKPDDLTGSHYLYLSMDASNQTAFTTRIFVDWLRATSQNGAPILSFGAPAFRRHENRRLGTNA